MPPPQGTWNPIEGPGDYSTTKIVHNDTYPEINSTKADLTGKAVFVSGASRGLGRSIALSFAKAGASYIAIAARSDLSETQKQLTQAAQNAGKKQPQVLPLKLEVSDPDSVTKAFEQIKQAFGKLDVIGDRVSIEDSDPQSWWQTCKHKNLIGYRIWT